MSLKRTAIGILVLLAVFPGSCMMNAKIPEYRAERICDSVELGQSFSTVEEFVRREGPPVDVYRVGRLFTNSTYIHPDHISVVYSSWHDTWRGICYIKFANGKVSGKEVRVID